MVQAEVRAMLRAESVWLRARGIRAAGIRASGRHTSRHLPSPFGAAVWFTKWGARIWCETGAPAKVPTDRLVSLRCAP